jgi:hypothetical protein
MGPWAAGSAAAVAFLVVGALYVVGSSKNWSPVERDFQGDRGISVERVVLSPDGNWLVWVDSRDGVVCVLDLRHLGHVACLDPRMGGTTVPIGVVEGDLLVLRIVPESGFVAVLERGLVRLAGGGGGTDDTEEGFSAGYRWNVFLERINIDTGRMVSRRAGLVPNSAERTEPVFDFESGAASLSTDGKHLAWWKAVEWVDENPLSATVTEVFEIFSVSEGLQPVLRKEFSTSGDLAVRSRLLGEVGRPVWLTERACLVLSFLDAGSFLPFDCQTELTEAAVPLSAVVERIGEKNPHVLYGPEGFFRTSETSESAPEIIFWGRQQDSVHFFRFNLDFQLEDEKIVDTSGFEFDVTLWLRVTKRLLIEDRSRNRLVAVSPYSGDRVSYPLPLDWEDGFQVLGEDMSGALVGTNRQLFMRTSAGRTEWETIELF